MAGMTRILQQFEQTVQDAAGITYNIHLYGRSRASDTWQGWLEFERATDGRRFSTDVETTQPNAEALLYWSTGLSHAYFEGALDRALHSVKANRPGDADSDRESSRLR